MDIYELVRLIGDLIPLQPVWDRVISLVMDGPEPKDIWHNGKKLSRHERNAFLFFLEVEKLWAEVQRLQGEVNANRSARVVKPVTNSTRPRLGIV